MIREIYTPFNEPKGVIKFGGIIMKKYSGFIRLLADGVKEGFVLIGRGILILVYIFVFVLWILATGVEKGFDKIAKSISRANDKLKAIKFETKIES